MKRIEIEQAVNGYYAVWIGNARTDRFIFSTPEELIDWLKEVFAPTKKPIGIRPRTKGETSWKNS